MYLVCVTAFPCVIPTFHYHSVALCRLSVSASALLHKPASEWEPDKVLW